MKVFEVEIERDGYTVSAPGVSETQIKRMHYYFASDSIDAVWKHVEEQILMEEDSLKSIRTVIESVGILASRVSPSEVSTSAETTDVLNAK